MLWVKLDANVKLMLVVDRKTPYSILAFFHSFALEIKIIPVSK